MVGPSCAGGGREVRIAVVGNGATGKSTLVAAMASESFPKSVPPVFPPTRLPHNLFPDSFPLTLIDTTSSLAKQGTRNDELKRADTVVLTYACDEPVSFESKTTYWLPELHKLEVKAPVIVVGCKLDLLDKNQLHFISPWNDAPYMDAAEKTDMGYISLNGFLSQWALTTSLDPQRSLTSLIYIGYNGNPGEALFVTHRRSVDRKKQTTERNVFQCYVFGSKHARKSALMYSLLGSSDEYSWKKSRDMLEKVVRQGELTGYRTLCLLIAAKDDLPPVPRTVLDSVKVTQALGIKAPIHVSMKLGDSSNVHNKIVNAAEQPHLSIPETETARRKKQHNQLLHHSLFLP